MIRKEINQEVSMVLTAHQYGLLWELLTDVIDNPNAYQSRQRDEYIAIWEELTGDRWEDEEEMKDYYDEVTQRNML